ncbi:MAG: hypothetical protein QNK04_07165 [Myxococcota bacterium]|nr:hypothetical protein [Myxococcota bacterium]
MSAASRKLAVPLLAAGLALGCDAVPGFSSRSGDALPLAGEAQVSVEIWSGFTQRPGAPPPADERIEIVLDTTVSMRATAPGTPARFVGARVAARRLLEGLHEHVSVRLWGLGGVDGEGRCTELELLSRADGVTPGEAAARLDAASSKSEASLAAALDELRGTLGDEVERTRVVLFSDLGAECGGDLCSAASALVETGARLDVVILSDALLPQCFAAFAPGGEPRVARLARPALPAAFRVDRHLTRTGETGPVLGRGRTGGGPVRVAAGSATLQLQMAPESTIGPLMLSPGTRTRVRVLDFPTLDPPVREWRWDVESLGSAGPGAPDSAGPGSALDVPY